MEMLNQFLSEILSVQAGQIGFFQGLMAVLIAYGGGVLSSFTPCVYPMIPITVSVIGGLDDGNKKQGRDLKRVILLSLVYVGGMTLVYALLGVVAGLTGRIFGTFTNTPGWYIGLGTIMMVAALIMLDVFSFEPATWIENLKRRFSGKTQSSQAKPPEKKSSYLGALTLGASSGLVAAPCTTPVLTAILAYIAKTQSVGLGFALMVGFSLGLGTLLLTIAFFAGAVKVLPRSGMWMKKVKLASGLLLLAFGSYLFYSAGEMGGL